MRRVQPRQHTRQPATEHIKKPTGARWNSMSCVCSMCVRGRPSTGCQKSSVWRPARPKRSGNVGVRHVPTKQNDCGGVVVSEFESEVLAARARIMSNMLYVVLPCSAFCASLSSPNPDLRLKSLMRTAAMRWIQNCKPDPDPTVKQKNIRPSAPSNSISRVCSRPAGTRIFKNRLFGGRRGRKGRETSRLAMFRGNKRSPVGRGVRIRV
jgi:hypothetical protein